MPKTFHCPNCSAPLDYKGEGLIVECPFCGSSVVVPETLRPHQAPRAGGFGQAHSLAEVVAELRAGRKINAIKKYREMTGLGLAEAKAAVEALESNGYLPSGTLFGQAGSLDELVGQAQGLAEVVAELQAGRKINAIKKYRDLTGAGLAEAKAAVEELETTGQLSSVRLGSGPVSQTQIRVSGQPVTVSSTSRGSGGLFLGFLIIGIILLSTGLPLYFGLKDVIFPVPPTPTVTPTPTPIPFGRLESFFGQEGTGPGYFQDARSMAVDAQGRVFVGDYDPGRIQAFTPDKGTLLWQHQTPGDTDYVRGMAADLQGRLYAVVGRNIEVFDANTGEQLAQWEPKPQQIGWYEAIAVTPQGDLVAVHPRELVKLSPEGETLLQVGGVEEDFLKLVGVDDFGASITGIAVDGEGTIYLGIRETFILKLSPEGQLIDRLNGEAEEDLYSLAVNGQGQIAWSYGYRVVLTDNNGQPLGDFKTGYLNDIEFNLKGQLVGISRNPPQVEIYTIGSP